mgnify:CR=1 FL=1
MTTEPGLAPANPGVIAGLDEDAGSRNPLRDPRDRRIPRVAGPCVLVMFGANWCVWCHRLHATFAGDARVAAALKAGYEVVLIDVNTRHGDKRNADVDARYGHPTKEGLPVLVVLDAAGKQLTTQETGALEEGAGHSPAKVVAFLEKWAAKG